MKALAIVALLLATRAHADPVDLGTPLPEASALPAMASLSPIVMSLDAVQVPELPPLDLGHGLSLPRRPETFGGFSVRSYIGGLARGRFAYYSIGTSFELGTAGQGKAPFMAGGSTYTSTGMQMLSIELPSPGYGYRTRNWLVGAQLVPAIEWISAEVTDGAALHTGRDHFYMLSADFQACRQYNMFGMFPKNSAVCAYVAPVIYRDGWGQGASFGIRVFAL